MPDIYAGELTEVIDEVSRTTPQGFGTLRFAALANCPPGSPFFPAAYHDGGAPRFAFATEAASRGWDLFLTDLGDREGYRPDALARWLTSVDYIHAEVTRQRLVDRLEAGVAVLEAGGQVQEAADAADTLEDLEEELEEDTGVSVRLPLDEKGADILLVTPSADFFAEPHVDGLMGYAKVFHEAGVSWTLSSHASEAANFGRDA